MLDIVVNNPYRVLGVLSNATTKEIFASYSKTKAYCNVGKQVKLMWDLDTFLPKLERSSEMVDMANNALSLPEDKLRHALFWFINASGIDADALECLKIGHVEQALSILWRGQNYSEAINRAVVYLVKEDWNNALKSYVSLVHDPGTMASFIHSVCGTDVEIPKEKVSQLLLEGLSTELPLYELYWSLAKCDDATLEKNRIRDMIMEYAENELNVLIRKGKDEKLSLDKLASVIENAYPYLAAIAEVEGKGSYGHRHWSTKVESFVLSEIVDIVNNAVEAYNSGKSLEMLGVAYFGIYDLRALIGKAKGLTKYLNEMDIEPYARQRLEKQNETLNVLISKTGTVYYSDILRLKLTTEWDCYRGCKTIQDFKRSIERFPQGLYKRMAQEAVIKRQKKKEELLSLCIEMDETLYDLMKEYGELGLLEEFDDKCFSVCVTVADYETYYNLLGVNAKHKKEIEAIIRDMEAFHKCKTFQDYKNYINVFPNGNHILGAQAAIDVLRKQAQKAIAQCNQMDESMAALKKTCSELGLLYELDEKCFSLCETIADFREYCHLFGVHAKHKEEVDNKLRDWDSFHNCKTFKDYQNYVNDYPEGQFINMAQTEIENMVRQTKDAIANYNQLDDSIVSLMKNCQEKGLLEEFDDKCFSLCSLISDFRTYYRVFGDKAKHKKEVEMKLEDWNFYHECKTFQDFLRYIERFPEGICINRARTVIEEVISRNRNAIALCNKIDEALVSLKKSSEDVGLLEEFDDKCFSLCVKKKDFRTYLELLGDNAKHKVEAEKHLKFEIWFGKIWHKS